ncbi:MAG: DUF2807 domain-containing protein [Bacteroidales bacterium]|nr:DUF2807 domain-containing protein [Bacteroidales bacterium]
MKRLPKKLLAISLLALIPISLMAQSSKVKKEKRSLSGFSAISFSGGWDAVLSQGKNFSVTIEANEESMENLRIEVKNETLYVYNEDRKFRFFDMFRSGRNTIRKVYITLPELQKITASGGSDILSQTPFSTENMKIVLSGGSDLKGLSLDCQSLNCKMSGGSDASIHLVNGEDVKITTSGGSDISLSGLSAALLDIKASGGSDLKLKGEATSLKVNASGGSDVSAFKLRVENCIATLSGGSDADLYVTDALNVSISGSGAVRCKGNPANVEKTLTRGSSLRMM